MNKDILLLRKNWQIISISFALGFLFSCFILLCLLALLMSSSPVPISTVTYTVQPSYTVIPSNTPIFFLSNTHTITLTSSPTGFPTPIYTETALPVATGITPVPLVIETSNPLDGVTAICNDGTYSYSQNRRGTCSRHGGVKEWINKPPN